MTIIIPAIIASAKLVGTTAAATATQTWMNKLFGGSASTKAANIAADVSPNTQHAIEDFNAIRTGQGVGDDPPKFASYAKYLSNEEVDALQSAILPLVQQTAGGYYGGLGNSYTSKYTNETYISVPAIGVAQDIDKYLNSRESIKPAATAGIDPSKIEVLDYFTQEGLLKKITDAQGNILYTTTEGQAVATTPALAVTAAAGFDWTYILIGAGVLLLILLRRR